MVETFSVDMQIAQHLGVAEAKARLSGLVADIERSGKSYVIERYGHPAALIVPIPRQRNGSHRARGMLADYSDPQKRTLEEGAFARAMEKKHGHSVGC